MKSLLLRADEVRGILDGTVTQIRRVVKLPKKIHPDAGDASWEQSIRCQWMEGPHHTAFIDMNHPCGGIQVKKCPFGKVGDKVRFWCHGVPNAAICTTSSIKVERVQDISEEDAKACGADSWDNRRWFIRRWNSIHGPGAWERNDWVWGLTVKTVEKGCAE